MWVRCEKCGRGYDDAECWTICPHGPLWAAADAYCREHDLVDCPMHEKKADDDGGIELTPEQREALTVAADAAALWNGDPGYWSRPRVGGLLPSPGQEAATARREVAALGAKVAEVERFQEGMARLLGGLGGRVEALEAWLPEEAREDEPAAEALLMRARAFLRELGRRKVAIPSSLWDEYRALLGEMGEG